jgi:HAD superfamily hydrolase (TIGR01549 family)
MIKAAIFDVDGVLLDSLQANGQFYRDLLAHFGLTGPTDDELRPVFHLPLQMAVRHFYPELTDEQVRAMADYEEKIESRFDLLRMPPGADQVIPQLANDYQLGIASGRSRISIDEFFQFSKLGEFFTTSVAFEDTEKHKPDPEPLLLAVNQLGVRPSEAVYIGDTAVDIEAARAAGMNFILFGPELLPGVKMLAKLFTDIPGLVKNIS